jgi:hypothetical protein
LDGVPDDVLAEAYRSGGDTGCGDMCNRFSGREAGERPEKEGTGTKETREVGGEKKSE